MLLDRPLPSLANRGASAAFSDTDMTRLGRAISPLIKAHPGMCGVYALPDGREAFAARMLLAQAAQRSLDVQYYIWRQDMSGMLLFDALRRAAERGVRVRLLLDDNNTAGLDKILAALDSHANIEVRLFNPFAVRRHRWLGYLTDFSRLNRRMHNKSFTADNQVTIVGGRNIGDEYFDATTDVAFVDLDVMAVGPVVGEVSGDFDRYWGSDSAFPIHRLLPPANLTALDEVALSAARIRRQSEAIAYLSAIRAMSFVRDLGEGRLSLEWAITRMVSDDPAKGLGRTAPETALPAKLKAILGEPAFRIDLVSPYFVPTDAGVDSFTAMARRGVKIRILTNALEATDVPAVHAGYAKRRKALLQAGIALFESRRLSAAAKPNKAVWRAAVPRRACTRRHSRWIAGRSSSALSTSIRGLLNLTPKWDSSLQAQPSLEECLPPLTPTSSRGRTKYIWRAAESLLVGACRRAGQAARCRAWYDCLAAAGVQALSLLPIESLL